MHPKRACGSSDTVLLAIAGEECTLIGRCDPSPCATPPMPALVHLVFGVVSCARVDGLYSAWSPLAVRLADELVTIVSSGTWAVATACFTGGQNSRAARGRVLQLERNVNLSS